MSEEQIKEQVKAWATLISTIVVLPVCVAQDDDKDDRDARDARAAARAIKIGLKIGEALEKGDI